MKQAFTLYEVTLNSEMEEKGLMEGETKTLD